MLHWNIYLYRHARPHTHKQPFIKGAKSLEVMVSFVYRGMNVILSFSPYFGTQHVSAIQNILLAKYTFQKYIIFTQKATIKESTQPHRQPKQNELCLNVPRNRYSINTSKLAYLMLGDDIYWDNSERKKKNRTEDQDEIILLLFFVDFGQHYWSWAWYIFIYRLCKGSITTKRQK